MIRCQECGYSNTPDTTVCKKCGSRIESGGAVDNSPMPNNPGGAVGGNKTVVGGGSSAPAWDGGAPGGSSQAPIGGAKTMMGNASNMPAWDEGASAPSAPASGGASTGGASGGSAPTGNVVKCGACGFYPLREPVSASAPCPNCGSKGNDAEQAKPVDVPADKPAASAAPAAQLGSAKGAAKTMMLGDLTPEDEEEPGFQLVEERSQKAQDFDGDSVSLNRDNLDKDNMSISGTEHAKIYQKDGQWYIQDRSSNGATFIQVKGEVALENGAKILLGNKIFTFKSE